MRSVAQTRAAYDDLQIGPIARAGTEKKAARFLVLDSWRGLCALLVAAYHFPFVGQGYALPFIRHAYLFVDFFFVLSGFVICYAYGDKIRTASDAGRFMLRRIGRVWPLHVAILAAFVLLESAREIAMKDGFGPTRSFASLADNLFLVHAWGFEKTLTWNGPSWSISVEFALYIAFAAALWLLPRRLALVSMAAAAAGVASVALWSPTYVGATVEYGLSRGFAGFFVGVLVCRLIKVWRPRVTTLIEALTVLAVVLFVTYAGYDGWRPLFACLVFGLAVFVFASEGGALSSVLSRPFALALGTWSYSIYMVHMLVISLFKIAAAKSGMFATHLEGTTTLFMASRPWLSDLLLPLYLAVVIGVSAVTFRLIEAPARQFFNGLAGRKTNRLQAVAS